VATATSVDDVLQELRSGADAARLESMPLPASYTALAIHKADLDIFGDEEPRDPSRTLKLTEVETPEIAPDEALIVVMASCINYNLVWAATFQPLSTFSLLERYGREGPWAKRHDQPYHQPGSDAAGYVLRTGSLVTGWKAGDEVTIMPLHVDGNDPEAQDDAMSSGAHRAWGFDTNFGGLGQLAVVKASMLMPRARHLSWEESAASTGCGASVYRCLVGDHGARMKQGEAVLIWGAAGGMGSYAVQMVNNGGGIPVGVVSSPERADLLRRAGCERVIDRSEFGIALEPDGLPNEGDVRAFGKELRRLVGKDPEIVFEHPGRDTMGASVYLAARGGRVVTNAATSSPVIAYDNRHLWMRIKTIIGSHVANAREGNAFNELIQRGMVVPTVSTSVDLAGVAAAAAELGRGGTVGKIAVRCCAAPGEGIEDTARREQVGEDRINAYRS
jgi:crotonyl-CoA reductase